MVNEIVLYYSRWHQSAVNWVIEDRSRAVQTNPGRRAGINANNIERQAVARNNDK
jgi:hypothetical protein